MTTAPGKRFERSRFKGVDLAAVQLPSGDLVRARPLSAGGLLPLLVEPAHPDVDLADWAAGNRQLIDEQLVRHGAILCRGFGIGSPAAFERFAAAVCRELFDENGEHPRTVVSGNVYTPVFYPPDKQLLWHNENSFNHSWPRKILFCCARPADRGGETPLVDSREVYRRLDPEVRERFSERGVLYVRHYGAGPGLDWQTVFRTSDGGEVEARCAREGLAVEWKDGGRILRTSCRRPAVVRHPVSGEPSWFNQAQHWHVACLDPETRDSIRAAFTPDDLPRDCRYGDGSAITDAEMEHVLAIYRQLEVCFPWQTGDVVLVDNVLTAHGRNPFAGERRILVALGDMASYDDV
jgi:alpha-ketoglutarate-dependent taurine dioxygenase